MVHEWCDKVGVPVRPLVSIEQLWGLATTWYSNRLKADARRPKPAEIRDIFVNLGLEDDFWDPLNSEPNT